MGLRRRRHPRLHCFPSVRALTACVSGCLPLPARDILLRTQNLVHIEGKRALLRFRPWLEGRDRGLCPAAALVGSIAHGATSRASSSLRTSVISAASRRVLVRAFSIARGSPFISYRGPPPLVPARHVGPTRC